MPLRTVPSGSMDVDAASGWPSCSGEGTIQLIDVREDYEWDAGRIPGARHLELGRVAAQAETIHRETPVVFYCRVGGRSAMAANAFRRAGYDAYTMTAAC